jgi:hypothetical protein
MANDFNKEERVAFEEILMGFDDALVLSRMVNVYRTDQQMMERTSDIIWRPMPYIARSFDGLDQTANFNDQTQLSVPATIGFNKSSPWILTAEELRDQLQEKRLGDAAKQKLGSDINVAAMNVAALQGTIVVDIAAASSDATLGGYASLAECDASMNEIGVNYQDRYAALSSRDYNGLAKDLADRQTMGPKVTSAYERSYVGVNAGFDTHKLDYANRIAAALGGATTLNGANQYYTPVATQTAATGERSNVDNRYQQITVSNTVGVVAGDAFTLAGVQSVHLITKQATGQSKTFRVISVDSGTTMTISPPIISAGGATQVEEQYKNVNATPADGAALTWLNTDAAAINPFWQKEALEILPGRYAIPENSGAAIIRGSTDQGFELVMTKFFNNKTFKIEYRCDTKFGVANLQPEMTGILLYGQTS